MRFGKFLIIILFFALINSCKNTTLYYKIPVTEQVMTIYSPFCRDYAYVCIGTSKLLEIDSMDFKISKDETTEISLIYCQLSSSFLTHFDSTK